MRTSAATSRGSSTTPARRTAGSRSSTRRFGFAPGATSAEAKSSPTIIRLTASARFRAAAVLAVGIKSNAMFIAAAAVAALALAADLPTGQVVPDVACAADSTQSYALYLPRDYNADRAWPVIFAFDPGGRGRVPVERYQAAAARYGFIVAGSNNSRNGSAENARAVVAMTGDVLSRFRADEHRLYLAGMSGGSRVALGVALGSPKDHVAGVIASSA